MSYYLIKVKMGHVGRNKYLPMILPIEANNLNEALKRAKSHGGVKRDHKDWCLDKPIEVDYEAYLHQETLTYADLYWNGKTKKNLESFEDRLIDEPNYHRNGDMKTNRFEFTKQRDRSCILYKLKKMSAITERGRIKYGRNLFKISQVN